MSSIELGSAIVDAVLHAITISRGRYRSASRPSSTGTLGTNTDAVSPGRRDRTNRPMAWATSRAGATASSSAGKRTPRRRPTR